MRTLKSSRHENGGQYINYFSWIANLGVVPLFLFAFFLLEPAPFFLAALLFVVTLVRETIKPPLIVNYSLHLNYKMRFLPFLGKTVKRILILAATLVLFKVQLGLAADISHDVILTRGQSTELFLPKLKKFNVGNKEILHYKFNEKNKMLLIRGNQIGHSEVLIWNSDNKQESFEVSVISKIQEEKIFHLTESLNSQGVSSKIIGTHIEVSGALASKEKYINFKHLKNKNEDQIIDQTIIENSVSKEIIAEIYQRFFSEYKDSIQCDVNQSDIICSYSEVDPPHESLKKYFIERYGIIFTGQKAQHTLQNYSLKIKLLQMEQLDGEELSLGLDQINGTLGELLSSPLTTIIQKNKVLLTQTNVSISTLAEPELILRPEVPGEIQIGSEIPFSVTRNTTAWKFAGLKIKINLENIGDQLKINFETELTQPSMTTINQASVSGTIGKSSVIVSLNRPIKIFQVSLRTQGSQTNKMPFLSAIPILGELFKSKSKQDNFKTITGIIEVKANE
jgi:Flp pilus assembly secretin CpaC